MHVDEFHVTMVFLLEYPISWPIQHVTRTAAMIIFCYPDGHSNTFSLAGGSEAQLYNTVIFCCIKIEYTAILIGNKKKFSNESACLNEISNVELYYGIHLLE